MKVLRCEQEQKMKKETVILLLVSIVLVSIISGCKPVSSDNSSNNTSSDLSVGPRFVAKIGDQTVFTGGDDIVDVCVNDTSCALIEKCDNTSEGYVCRFFFGILLSDTAAKRQADIVATLDEVTTQGGNKILSKTLDLYVDNNLTESLQMSSNLNGTTMQRVGISGKGTGDTEESARLKATENMKYLQDIILSD